MIDELYFGIGYGGEEVFLYISSGDYFCVWWVESGPYKVLLIDVEFVNGIFDYVELVAL